MAGKRRLDSRPAALPFEALDQPRLLAADVRPCAAVDPDVEIEAAAVDVLAQVSRRTGLGDRRLEDPVGLDVLEPEVEVRRPRPGGEAGDQDPLEQLMRVLLHQVTVVEGRRLALVGVDAHERFLPVLRKERPFQTAREPCAAAAAKLRVLDQVDHRVGSMARALRAAWYPPRDS